MSCTQAAISAVCEALCPGHAQELLEASYAAQSSQRAKAQTPGTALSVDVLAQLPMVQKIKGQYLEASKANRPAVLAALVVQFTRNQLNEFVFNGHGGDYDQISKRELTAARFHQQAWGVGMPSQLPHITVSIIKKDVILEAMQHILNPDWIQQVAHGTKDLHLSNGLTIQIPALQRQMLRERMWDNYNEQHLGSSKQVERSTYLKAASAATASQQRTLAALDNVAQRYGAEILQI